MSVWLNCNTVQKIICHLIELAGAPLHACRYTLPATPTNQLTSAGTSGIHSTNLLQSKNYVMILHKTDVRGEIWQYSNSIITFEPLSRLIAQAVYMALACRRPLSLAASRTPSRTDQICLGRPHRTLRFTEQDQ